MSKTPKIGVIGLGGQSVFLQVDHFHTPGETIHAESLFSEPGGKGYNQVVAAKRLGADCVFLGAMGRDANGAYCEQFLLNEGIEAHIQHIDNVATAYACILTDRLGENRVTVYRGAADHLSASFIREKEFSLKTCDILLLGLECPLEATLEALAIAEEHGIFTILNPAPMQHISTEILQRFNLITPNYQEAATLIGSSPHLTPAQLAKHLQKNGIQNAVVTLGADGALLLRERSVVLYPALKVKSIDTTGAGDCFNAALAVALGSGQDFGKSVELAINSSGYSVLHHSVMNSLPTADQIRTNFRPIKGVPLDLC